MIPVYQTTFGEVGNCLPACIASLLELSIDDVPCFLSGDWYDQYDDWLETRDIALVMRPVHLAPKDDFYILAGMSPRGRGHVVIAKDGEIIHDPHPDNAGLVSQGYIFILAPLNKEA